MRELRIRKVLPQDDLEAISRIYALSWKTAYAGIVPQDYLDELPELRWMPLLKDSHWDSYVVMDGENYAGTSAIGPAREEKLPGWGEIVSIYLLPEYFGKGFGRPLLDNSVSSLRAAGFEHIYLWVLEDNIRARKFYEKSGFILSSDRAQLNIGGKDLTEVRYVL